MSHGGIMQPLYVILNHYWTSINHLLIFIGEDIWFYTPWYHSSLCAPASSRFSSGSLWNGGVIVHFMFVQVQVGPLGDSDSLYGDIVSNTGVNASFCDRMIIYGVTNGNLRWRSFHIWHAHTLKGLGLGGSETVPNLQTYINFAFMERGPQTSYMEAMHGATVISRAVTFTQYIAS